MSDPADILYLNPDDMITEGGERMVFAHPDDPSRLIKVVKPRYAEEFPGWSFGHITQRHIPAARIRSTVKQYEEYNRLMLGRLFDPDFKMPISHLYGFVKTNLGLGCLTERVTDENGANAPTLNRLLRLGQLTDDRLAALNDLISQLYEVSVCASDVQGSNFVYGHRHIGGAGQVTSPQWVLIDGFGDRFAIPLRTYSRRVRTLGLDDAFQRKKTPKGLVWDKAARMFRRAQT